MASVRGRMEALMMIKTSKCNKPRVRGAGEGAEKRRPIKDHENEKGREKERGALINLVFIYRTDSRK